MKNVLFLIVIMYQQIALGLVSCPPSSNCPPGCGQTCTYYTCDQNASHSVVVNQLPITVDTDPTNACGHIAFSSNVAPFTVVGVSYNSMPVTVAHDYFTCQSHEVPGGVCATCSDGVQNQGEAGVDCGGPCSACAVAPTCSDGIQNQGEAGVDCGGPCSACAVGCPPTALKFCDCYCAYDGQQELGYMYCPVTETCSDPGPCNNSSASGGAHDFHYCN